jgi:ferredoxin-NADP reductase
MAYNAKTEDDIIYQKELDLLAKNNPEKFKTWYTISRSVKPGN